MILRGLETEHQHLTPRYEESHPAELGNMFVRSRATRRVKAHVGQMMIRLEII